MMSSCFFRYIIREALGNKYIKIIRSFIVVEPLLSGIVLGLIFVTLGGLFFKAYEQYKRGNTLGM